MKKFLYFSISLSVLVISFAFLYRYIVYLPQIVLQKEKLDNEIRCMQEGTKLYEKEKAEIDSSLLSSSSFNPKFKFSSDGVCYYSGGSMTSLEKGYMVENFIVDVYRNEKIAWYISMNIDGEKTVAGNEDDYNEKNGEIFIKNK